MGKTTLERSASLNKMYQKKNLTKKMLQNT